MVLSNEQAKSIIKNMSDNQTRNIMFLNVDHLPYPSDRTKLDCSVEILNNIAILSKANQLFTDLGVDQKMDINILSEAITSIYSNTPFDNAQLTRYFELYQKFERFSTIMIDWHDMERYFLPHQMEYFLLGMPFDLAYNDNINDALSERYGDISIDTAYGRMEVSDFIEQAKKMISEQVESHNLKTRKS